MAGRRYVHVFSSGKSNAKSKHPTCEADCGTSAAAGSVPLLPAADRPDNGGRPESDSAGCKTGGTFDSFCRMAADLRPIIDEIANQADDFLAGVSDRAQARAGISELLTMDYSHLNPADRTIVITCVMSVLEHEDFFGTEFVGDPFADDQTEDEG
jgi:hypothetical protein